MPRPAPTQRLYAIGDIHGRADLLDSLLTQIEADAKNHPGPIGLIFLGDYIDRGPHSAQVITRLLQPFPSGWQTIFIKGNHEWAMENFLQNTTAAPEWLHWGGLDALQSYGVKTHDATGRMRPPEALAAEMKHVLRNTGHDTFFAKLKLYWQFEGYAFVHAGVRRGIALPDQLDIDLLMIREGFLNQPHGLPQRIVFGHTIFKKPLIETDRLGLDTGAFESGILTAAVLEGGSVRLLQTGK